MLPHEVDPTANNGIARRDRRRAGIASTRLDAAKVLFDLARDRARGETASGALTAIAHRAAAAAHADAVGIYVRHEATDQLELAATHSRSEDDLGALGHPPKAGALWEMAAKNRILIPVHVDDELVGLLVCAWTKAGNRPSARAIQRLQRLGARAALAIAVVRVERATARAVARVERERLAALLHDTASQTLFSLGLKLELALRGAERHPRLRGLLEAVKKDAGMTMTHVRQLSAPAKPVETSTDAASARLGAIIQEFRDLTGLPVLLVENAPSLPVGADELDALAMVIQSGLANVAQDGKVHRAEIRLDVTGDQLAFEVTGHGADTSAAAHDALADSFAVAMMMDRVRAVGGSVEFLPGASATFRLRGSLPLRHSPDTAVAATHTRPAQRVP
jgi:signal transduction histidine kinase